MNNKVIKAIAYVASGAICGALGGYYVAQKRISEEYEKIIKEVEDNIKDYQKRAQEELRNYRDIIQTYEDAGLSYSTAQVIAEKNRESVEETTQNLDDGIAKQLEDLRGKYTNYSRVSTPSTDDADQAQSTQDVEDHTPSKEVEDEQPYIISVDDFSDTHEEYRKVSCTFYEEDRVLCETTHSEIIEPKHVGEDNIEMITSGNYESDIMYVRNDYLGIDYEIDIYNGSYSYEVLGEESMDS